MELLGKLLVPLEGLAEISRVTVETDHIHGAGDGFAWETRFTPHEGGTWIETTLFTDRAITFNPALIIWLGALDNLNDRQAHTWRQTILRAPTTNQQGLGGNDLPAAYVYDPDHRTHTFVYFPPDAFEWAVHRFYEFAIHEITEYRPSPRYGIGLIPTSPSPLFTFRPGKHVFRLWHKQTQGNAPLSLWAAQNALIQAINPLLDTQPTLVPDAPSWDTMAQGTLKDLHEDACWIDIQGKTGLRAYVRGSSEVKRDEAQSFELMTQADVLLPLLNWRKKTGSKSADGVIEKLLDAVRAYKIIEPHRFLPNHYPYKNTDTFMDTWYFYENALIKLPQIAALTDDVDLKQTFFTALEGGRELAQKTRYLLPLFADASDWEPRNSALNVGVSGMYAAGCVLAYQMTGDAAHLDEAKSALGTIHQLPPHMLTHEPQQLSFAAAAAFFLHSHMAPKQAVSNWLLMGRDFVNLSLRMGYWGKDPAVPFYDPRGMFQACASLCYPAYKENVEVIWAWSELIGTPGHDVLPVPLMAAFANLQRCHNYAFFDPFLPESMRRGPCPYVPYEDLATAEFTHTATLGKELYGAGEVFWSALLFASPNFMREAPRDILALSLDVPCLRLPVSDAPTSSRWLLYNPRAEAVELQINQDRLLLAAKSAQIVEGE
jgi:hypothetical protein